MLGSKDTLYQSWSFQEAHKLVNTQTLIIEISVIILYWLIDNVLFYSVQNIFHILIWFSTISSSSTEARYSHHPYLHKESKTQEVQWLTQGNKSLSDKARITRLFAILYHLSKMNQSQLCFWNSCKPL